MNRNNYLRLSVTVLLGVIIPLLSGLFVPAHYHPAALLITCFFFIALTFLIVTVTRIVQLRLREQSWLNHNLLKKISATAAVNALISVFIAGILVYIWILFTGQRISTGIVLQYLADMVLGIIILTLCEELLMLNREKKIAQHGPQALVAESLPPVGAVLQQDNQEDLPSLIENGSVIIDSANHRRKSRLLLRKGYENIPVKLEDIALFYTENKIVYAVDGSGKKYLADKKLSELEAELNTDLFFRANRQYIIGLNFIKGFKPFEKVKLQVDLTVSDVLVIISQETAPAFRKWMSEA
ncbi:LytR/AlgR family response regulator transcription factor [Pseudobacter ginsenosidimutans]|uniref:LytTr DNA-binding domain-containing protein n=1 Tax=Pseudobacter ginsenosidimutans TaxID=661488 RepID=A0A4Q7N4G0_9BACT|nr:LytTR family DNA-binding domain-containing protein [Pseudobacter ginsenosidimutans]QEC44414.1 LytTR family transcriptional regulator [Pseudobacter ginsenosidimutans]RZS75885.1 LytTr DNA-binding domain-containing protein [Pseudobacter ginsenosidimutans]